MPVGVPERQAHKVRVRLSDLCSSGCRACAVPSFAVPAQPSGSLGVKRDASGEVGQATSKRLRTSSATKAMAAQAAGNAANIVRTRMTPRRPSPVVRQLGSDHLQSHDYGSATAPSSWALRNRMYKIANETGLGEISPDAVNLMTFAMEHHLKDILSSCKRARSSISASGRADGLSPAFSTSVQPVGTITARDMLTMVQHRPYLLGEDLPVNQERILLMQEDY